MKIVYLHQYFKTPNMSGGTRSYEMARRFAMAGHEVHVVTTHTAAGERSGWSTSEIDGVTVHWLGVPYDNRMSHAQRVRAFVHFALRSSAFARGLRPDLVFASSTPLTIAIPAVAASWHRAPMVFEVRDLWPEVPIAMGALPGRVMPRLAWALARFAYRRSSAVVALSPGMADGVRQAGFSGVVRIIPNSCDNELFDVPDERGTRFREARPWLGSRPLVVYAGTFGRVNDMSYMVDLAYEFLALDSEVRFLAVGDGAERDVVLARARALGVLDRNFYVEAPVAKRHVADLLSAATVCTSWVIPVPALEANSANKVFDGLAAGRPVVVNHGGWLKTLIEREGVGLALDSTEPALAARQLNSLLRDRAGLRIARARARALAGTQFSRDRLATELLELLETVHGCSAPIGRTDSKHRVGGADA